MHRSPFVQGGNRGRGSGNGSGRGRRGSLGASGGHRTLDNSIFQKSFDSSSARKNKTFSENETKEHLASLR